MNMWLAMERFVYFDATSEERKKIYEFIERDYSMLLDLVYIMCNRAEEEVMGDTERLAQLMEAYPQKETFEVGYMERDPNGRYGKLRGVFDDEPQLALFLSKFNKYLNTD